MRRHGRAHGGILAAQERIAGTFVVEGGWQAGLVCRAQAADFGGAFAQGCVTRIDRGRKGRVRQRVFVPAADQSLAGQGRQALQRGMHLRGRAFEHPPAAQAEQGIPAEQQAIAIHVMAMERDMAAGMPGDLDGREPPRAGFDDVTIDDATGRAGDAFVLRRDHRYAGPVPQQVRHAADVVVVVVGQQDRVRRWCASQRSEYRRGLAGIDDHGSAGGVAQQPDDVVLERWNLLQRHLSSP